MKSAASVGGTGKLDGVSLSFAESMSGCIRPGVCDPRLGAEIPLCPDDAVRFDVRVRIADLGRFVRDLRHRALLTGSIYSARLGGTFEISQGRFELFSVDAATGARQMVYSFRFTVGDQPYFLRGLKHIRHHPWHLDLLKGMTRLFCTLHRGEDENAPLCGAGVLRFHLIDGPALLASMQVEGALLRRQKLAAVAAFLSVAWSALRNEYFRGIRLFYETRYENLVLRGLGPGPTLSIGADFLLASGAHEKGFPWGDGELFWDVLLVIADGQGGYRRYCIADRILPGLELDVATGFYRYAGPIVEVDADSTPVSQTTLQADIRVEFDTYQCDAVTFPFPRVHPSIRRRMSRLTSWLWEALPGTNPLGISIQPHAASVRLGSIRIMPLSGGTPLEDWTFDRTGTWGECERGTFRSPKAPRLGYRYRCAVDPEQRSARVEVVAGTLRSHCPAATAAARLVSSIGSAEMIIENGALRVGPVGDHLGPGGNSVREGARPVLQVRHTRYPTAVFERRIIELESGSGKRRLALEEAMSAMRLEPIHSDRTATVASIRDGEPLRALDRALEAAGFDRVLESRLQESGIPRASFPIAIKPNFMFAYDRRDRSTYTDPALVHHLVRRLRSRGFECIQVVESHSSYGEYFDRRSVSEMAEYLGYDTAAGYELVDLTLDRREFLDFGPALGRHPVPRAWRDAGFRISFAKNKTHPYSFYTLTLKNVYGALPLANKFKEYHCDRDIYHTTIEYLAAFPVHFGIIDAHLSADGPFGVFASPSPRSTATIISGDDLVAVDWVGATLMGLDPMKSRHMQLAVRRFGKPRIHLIGEDRPYPGWRNVPGLLTFLTNTVMDASYPVGNLLYSVSAQMDETRFHHKGQTWYVRMLRAATVPIRRVLFLHSTANSIPDVPERRV